MEPFSISIMVIYDAMRVSMVSSPSIIAVNAKGQTYFNPTHPLTLSASLKLAEVL